MHSKDIFNWKCLAFFIRCFAFVRFNSLAVVVFFTRVHTNFVLQMETIESKLVAVYQYIIFVVTQRNCMQFESWNLICSWLLFIWGSTWDWCKTIFASISSAFFSGSHLSIFAEIFSVFNNSLKIRNELKGLHGKRKRLSHWNGIFHRNQLFFFKIDFSIEIDCFFVFSFQFCS